MNKLANFCSQCGKPSNECICVKSDRKIDRSISKIGTGAEAFFDMFPNEITPCEGEEKVKAYHCAELQSKFLKTVKAEGILTITNKRVIFRTKGLSNEKNFIHSELPILEVSGITMCKGRFFDLFKFLIMYLFGAPIVIGVPLIIPRILASIFTPIFKSLFDMSRNATSTLSTVLTLLFLIVEIVLVVYFAKKGKKLSQFGDKNFSQKLVSLLNPFQPALVFQILSKTGGQGGIGFAAGKSFGFLDISANPVPSDEAVEIASEIGAVITDIQQLGDKGIKKWQQGQESVDEQNYVGQVVNVGARPSRL